MLLQVTKRFTRVVYYILSRELNALLGQNKIT